MTNFQSDFGGVKRFFDIFLLLKTVSGGVAFWRRIAQSKVELKGLLLSYSEHATDIGTTSTSPIKCAEFQKKHDSSPKNVDFFENFKKKPGFRKLFGFFENF